MPYFITKDSEECAGWAVVKEDGEVLGCHLLKQDAVDQMVAISQEEGIEPGGELEIEETDDAEEMAAPAPIRFSSDHVTLTAKGKKTREITAIAVPWNTFATVSDGTEVSFLPGSLPVDGKAPRVFMYHDASKPVGIVAERVDTGTEMLASMKISRTSLGDEALVLAADGVMDVSVGVNPIEFEYDDKGRMIVAKGEWLELSLVPIPAFAGATITDVAASAAIPDTQPTESTKENRVEASPAQAEVVEAAATIPTAPLPAQPKRAPRMPSASEYLAAMHIGGDTFRKVNEQYIEFARSQQSVLEAAAGDVLTTDTPGLLPVPVVAPVFQDINFVRPFVAAIGARAFPDGGNSKTFIRPTWSTHTSVAEQASELTGASATTPVIASNVVTKKTFAGQVTLSVQDIDFTNPAALQIILQDLAGEYAVATDNYAVDTFVTAAYSAGTWDGTVEDFISDVYLAAQNIAGSGRNYYPTHMLVGIDTWKKIGSLVDQDKRPVFPYIGQANLLGTNTIGGGNVTDWSMTSPLGLQLIVDTNVAAKTMVIFNARAAEYYEQVRGLMSVEVPSTLGRTFSYYGYGAFFLANNEFAQKFTWS